MSKTPPLTNEEILAALTDELDRLKGFQARMSIASRNNNQDEFDDALEGAATSACVIESLL